MKLQIIIPIVLSILLITGSTSNAFHTEEIMVHGFFGQGYLNSDKNNYFGVTKGGSYEFNEIGLNFTVPINDALHFGIQFFSRDTGVYGNNDLHVDWAFMDYRWQDWIGFRAGKIKMPFGLYNRQRDADIVRTSIILPQSVYNEQYRDMIVSFQGASAYGVIHLGDSGYIDYEIFTGTTEIEYTQYSFDSLMGGLLVWNTPVSGLRIGSSYIHAEGKALDTFDFIADPIRVFSVEFEKGSLLISAEYNKMDVELDDVTIMDSEGWYGTVSWKIRELFEAGVTYSEYYPDDDDKSGKVHKASNRPDYYAWQKDTTLSFRVNISESWAIKFETHFINGVGLIETKTDTDESWNLYGIKTSLTF